MSDQPVINQTLESLGLFTPTRRFIAGALIAGGLLYWIKPDSMFFDGYARPWSWLAGPNSDNSHDGSVIPPTALPWWLAAALVGALAALFL